MGYRFYQTQASHYLFNTYNRYPITLVKGKGAFLWDIHNKKYLDFLSGIGSLHLVIVTLLLRKPLSLK